MNWGLPKQGTSKHCPPAAALCDRNLGPPFRTPTFGRHTMHTRLRRSRKKERKKGALPHCCYTPLLLRRHAAFPFRPRPPSAVCIPTTLWCLCCCRRVLLPPRLWVCLRVMPPAVPCGACRACVCACLPACRRHRRRGQPSAITTPASYLRYAADQREPRSHPRREALQFLS